MQESYPMTEAGKKILEDELVYLKEEKQKEINTEMKEQRAFCDFSDNASFSQLLDKEALMKKRIATIEEMLLNAELIDSDKEETSAVRVGTTVKFMELPDGEEESYTIVGSIEADPLNNKISMDSPIGKSLLGSEKNDEVVIDIPSGKIKVKVINLC